MKSLKELFQKNKGKAAALTVTGITALGVAISPELGNFIADILEYLEAVVRGVSVE